MMKEARRQKGKNSGFLSKLSRGLMIPVAVLPVAGLLLGVGSGITNIMNTAGVVETSPWYLFPTFITEIGNIVFANLPILFAMGVVIAFTNDSGVAVFSGFLGWAVFCVVQDIFIFDTQGLLVGDGTASALADGTNNLTNGWQDVIDSYPLGGIEAGLQINLADSKASIASQAEAMAWLNQIDVDNNEVIDIFELNDALIITNDAHPEDINITTDQAMRFIDYANTEFESGFLLQFTTNYDVLFYQGIPSSVITQNIGITSMQTSVFGGIVVGFVVAWLYNKFYRFETPKVLGFFSGTKFVPIVVVMFTPIVSFFFLFTWPPIGEGLEVFGSSLSDMPVGLDALLFGLVERALIPFGLHHAFYTPLWFTSAGGSFYAISASGGDITYSAFGNNTIWFAFQNFQLNFDSLNTQYWYTPSELVGGLDSLPGTIPGNFATDEWMFYSPDHNGIISGDTFYVATSGMNPGSYLQGKYSFMIFGLPAAGAAMIMAADKNKRELALSIIGAAVFTSFLTGITEPIEFTFLFIAPALYLFHVVMAGCSFWFDNILNMSMGMTFSGGAIDFVLYGIVPWASGTAGVLWWYSIIIGIVYMPIYYVVFYSYIKYFDVLTPGREGSEVKLVSKAEYKEARKHGPGEGGEIGEGTPAPSDGQASLSGIQSTEFRNTDFFKSLKPTRQERVAILITILGGMENLETINSCATRLRLVIKDRDKVDATQFVTQLGASGSAGKGTSLQIVFGGEANIFASELLAIRKELNIHS